MLAVFFYHIRDISSFKIEPIRSNFNSNELILLIWF